MRILVPLLMTLALSACVTAQQRQSNDANRREAVARLNAAAANASLACPNATTCDKAFRLTKIYVQENSGMKIQLSDDTLIQTYNPISLFDIGITAKKVPGKGDTSTIELTVICKDTSFDSGANCPNRQAQIYEGFKAFVESRMN